MRITDSIDKYWARGRCSIRSYCYQVFSYSIGPDSEGQRDLQVCPGFFLPPCSTCIGPLIVFPMCYGLCSFMPPCLTPCTLLLPFIIWTTLLWLYSTWNIPELTVQSSCVLVLSSSSPGPGRVSGTQQVVPPVQVLIMLVTVSSAAFIKDLDVFDAMLTPCLTSLIPGHSPRHNTL